MFENHLRLLGGQEQLPQLLARMKDAACEEGHRSSVTTLEEAWQAIDAGADGLQFDKVAVEPLTRWCPRNRCAPSVGCLSRCRRIAPDNIQDYAA